MDGRTELAINEKDKKTSNIEINYSDLRMIEPIGEGHTSKVYTCKWQGKNLAVKIARDFKQNDFLYNEIEIMQLLTSSKIPHIVNIHGYVLHECTYHILIDYLPNRSLGDFIEKHKTPLDWTIRYKMIKQLVSAVDGLHQKQIIHRDIKADNLFLDLDFNVKLGDFGYAIKIENKPSGNIAGTIGWVAPEKFSFDEEPDSTQTDIFSLAMTMWEIVAWKYPFLSFNYEESIINWLVAGKRETIPEDPEVFPIKFAKLIKWGWRRQPESRPSTKEILKELDSDVNHSSEKLLALKL